MAEDAEKAKIEWFKKNSIGNEVSFGLKPVDSAHWLVRPTLPKVFEYTGNSVRFSTDTAKLIINAGTKKEKSLCLNTKLMMNTDKDNVISPQMRNTLSTSDLKIAKWGNTNFSANLEDRVTVKLDNKFKMQDIQNSARINLKAQNGDNKGYLTSKFDCSLKNPDLTYNGLTLGYQRDLGKKFSVYFEAYVPKENYQGELKKPSPKMGDFVGNLKNTSFGIGAVYKF